MKANIGRSAFSDRCRSVGDPGADRLLELASELEAQANAMDEPTVRVSLAIEPSAASGQSTCSRKAP
jgi:hypothetical protein